MKSSNIKRCLYCGRFLSEDDFNFTNRKRGYRQSCCKRCQKNNLILWCEENPNYFKQYHINNKEKRSSNDKIWREKNKNYNKIYYHNNKENISNNHKQWAKDNRDKNNLYKSMYRAKKLNQTPDNANQDIIQYYYTVASTMFDYEVDHYQPLNKGGLHYEDNLQILLIPLNREKSDKWPLTEEEKIRYKGYRL